jgi:MYXO-CTERM domain-containing protein
MLHVRRILALLFVWVAIVLTTSSTASAHWCNDLWNSSYNIVVRPASDTITIPASGSATLDVWVQNNMGYFLPNFTLAATASGYTIQVARQTTVRSGFLMPTEDAKFTLTISKSGGGTLQASSLSFSAGFANGQDGLYGPNGKDVVIRSTTGALSTTVPIAPVGDGQGRELSYMAAADFGSAADQSTALDDLMQFYCVGRVSWSAADSDTQKCGDSTSSTCADSSKVGTGNGDKFQYAHLWSATEMAARKAGLGAARTAELRKRLQCGASDANLGFAGIALMALGYLGEDATARTYLQGLITAGGDKGTIAKAALVLMGNAADLTANQAALTTGLSSSNVFVSAACAAALGIAAKNDDAVKTGLIQKAAWNEPDTSDNGQGLYPGFLLSLVAWDRRGWAPNGADKGAISFYGDSAPPVVDGGPVTPPTPDSGTITPPPPTGPVPAAPLNPKCTAQTDGSINVTWTAVTKDTKGAAITISSYKVYYGTKKRVAGATDQYTGGFAYDRSSTVTVTTAGLTDVGGLTYIAVAGMASTGVGPYSAEVTCTSSKAVPPPPTGTGGSTDSTGSTDNGEAPGDPGTTGGCSCSLGARGGSALALFGMALLGLALSRRRR